MQAPLTRLLPAFWLHKSASREHHAFMPLSSRKPDQPLAPEPSRVRKTEEAAFRLTLLGSWDLIGKDGRRVQSVLSQPKRLCLLAYLALSERPVARSIIVAMFWPETDEEHARNALSQSLHYLRRSMGKPVIKNVEGDRIMVPPGFLAFDARALLAWDASGVEPESMPSGEDLSVWTGDFFEGWNADGSQPLQDWLDATRLQVHRAQAKVSDALAERDDVGVEIPNESGSSQPAEEGGLNGGSRAGVKHAPPEPTFAHSGQGRLVALAMLAMLLVSIGWWLGRSDGIGINLSPSGPAATSISETAPIAVLMPRLFGSGMVDSTSLAVIHAEILERLATREPGLQLHSVPFAQSPLELQRILDAQGAESFPLQVTDVLIVVDGASVRMTAKLLAGPGYMEVATTASNEYVLDSDADAIRRLPGWIADQLAAEFGRALRPR